MDRTRQTAAGPWIGAALLAMAVALSGCGGGGSDPPPSRDAGAAFDGPEGTGSVQLEEPRADRSSSGTSNGRIVLQWSDTASGNRYSVWVSPREGAGFAEIAADVRGMRAVIEPRPSWAIDWPSARVGVRSCDAAGTCADSNAQPLAQVLADSRASLIPNVDPDQSTVGGNRAFAISDDGRTIAALRATAMGMYGTFPADFSPARLDIYQRSLVYGWMTPTGLPTPHYMGTTHTLALSGDGRTAAMPLTYSHGGYSPIGVPGVIVIYTFDDLGEDSGVWRMQGVISAPPEVGIYERLDGAIALSDDGRRLAATATGNPATSMTEVLVFDRGADDSWRYRARFPAHSAQTLAMSGNGQVLAMSTLVDGMRGVQLHRTSCACGQAGWRADGVVRSDEPSHPTDRSADDGFADAGLALDDTGTTLAVGAPRRGGGGAPGAVYVFSAQPGQRWQRADRLAIEGETANDLFGQRIALSGDGRVLAGSACGRLQEPEGVDRAYPVSPAPADRYACRSPAQQGDRHGTQVFRRSESGPWSPAALVVPTLPALVGDPAPGDVFQNWIFPLLGRDGSTLALGVYRNTDYMGIRPGAASLVVY